MILVNQLNYGTDLLTLESEKYQLAELNLLAGQKAKAATAYESAVKYLNVGLGLLAEDCWESQYELTLNLYLELAEAEFITTNFERSQQLSAVIIKQAKTILEKIKVYELKIQFEIAENRAQSAIDTGISVLEMFGISLEQKPPEKLIIEDLVDLQPMTDIDKLAASADINEHRHRGLSCEWSNAAVDCIYDDKFICQVWKLARIGLRLRFLWVSSMWANGGYRFWISI